MHIGNIRLPVDAENKSFFVVGSPGRGKTQLVNPVIVKAKQRKGVKGIVFDLKNEFYSSFATDKDLLFNPVDSRSLNWQIFSDISNWADIELMVTAIIPLPKDSKNLFWIGAARDLLATMLRWCILTDNRTNRAIWECMTIPREELKLRFEMTPGCERGLQYLADTESRETRNFFTELQVHAGFFEYMAVSGENGGKPFSIAEWLESGSEWIFISSMPKIEDMLRPATNLFLSVAIAAHLSLPEDTERRVFYLLDEFAALGRLPNIEKVPLQLRSKGGSLWAIVQDFGKFDDIYGRSIRNSIVNGCGNFISFGVEDADTAEAVAKKIGRQEYYENEVSFSFGVGNNRDGESSRQAKKYEYVLLPEELMELKSFHCVVSVNDFGKAMTRIQFKIYKKHRQGFMLNPAFDLKAIIEKQVELKVQESNISPARKEQEQELERYENTGNDDESGQVALELDIDQY